MWRDNTVRETNSAAQDSMAEIQHKTARTD
jgi:hypothetical protein